MNAAKVQFGLGLIGIGRVWGYVPGEVPPENEALDLLEYAFDLGVRTFDTAPSYGVSEERFGKFLRSLSPAQRRETVVATKFGERWDPGAAAPVVDHSLDSLKRSLDGSLERLGPFEVLQLHMARPHVLRSDDVARAWDYALSLGVPTIGPSVKDPESARIAIAEPRYGCLQLPLSLQRPELAGFVDAAGARGMWVAVNGPVARGEMLYGENPPSLTEAFAFILRRRFGGAILTGTRSKAHLKQNWDAFHAAQALREGAGPA